MTGNGPCPDAAPADEVPVVGGERTEEEAAAGQETPPEDGVIADVDTLSIAAPEWATSGAARGKGVLTTPEGLFGSRAKISSARDAAPTLRWVVADAGGAVFTRGREDAGGSGRS